MSSVEVKVWPADAHIRRVRADMAGAIADRLSRALFDPLAQVLARLEVRHMLARQGNGLAGLGIAPLARRPEVQREAAKAADLDALPL